MTEEQGDAIKEVSRLLFLSVYDLQRTVMQEWQSLNLSMAQLKMLFVLSFKGPVTISKLAKVLVISHATASHLVDRLVQAGLAERAEYNEDRRFTLARLTEAGDALSRRLWLGRMEHLQQCLAQLDEQDLAALRQGLRSFYRVSLALSEEPAADEPHEKGPPKQ
ncbi:MarR family transcriptional regulator [Ktedonosporobacter rubrisoli]|uniref:MarR family transcriptional regulator n=1 Tax=Ktedonosporobacter rubrisoli TaxID=2509675 RepID=A0A4P6JXB7_KTERU|nr:MarR family transcriptional regulator [Ktedonosporobacter rubrisoli]QBD80274.1 MarR family transcriptional regulator [Ktedonosporobacter rubrisoli]